LLAVTNALAYYAGSINYNDKSLIVDGQEDSEAKLVKFKVKVMPTI